MFSQNLYDFTGIIRSIRFFDVLDILLVAVLVYQVIKLLRETRAMQLMKGIIGILLFYFLAQTLELKTISFLLKSVLQVGFLAILVLFQPELRKALEHVGRSNFSTFNLFSQQNEVKDMVMLKKAISIFAEACGILSKKKTGALIVFERKTKLGEIIKTGTVVDATPSVELIGNLFFVNSPLHDGAMIVRDGRIHAGGCFLPLSENYTISNELGTRHRAALGMSENSDAVVVVVSEETGVITVAQNGRLIRGLTPEQLATKLRSELIVSEEDKQSVKKNFAKVKKEKIDNVKNNVKKTIKNKGKEETK